MSVSFSMWVAEVQDPCILRLDFLRLVRCLLDLGQNTMSFPGCPTVKMMSPPIGCESCRDTMSHYRLPSHGRYFPVPEFRCSPELLPNPFSTWCHTPLPCECTAPTHPPVCLEPRPLSQSATLEESDKMSALREIWKLNCDGLDSGQQEELWQLLFDFKDIFALRDGDVGLAHPLQHKIDTENAKPVCTPSCLLMAHREAADKAVEEIQQAGFIEPPNSPWALVVVVVSKKWSPKMRFLSIRGSCFAISSKMAKKLSQLFESSDSL